MSGWRTTWMLLKDWTRTQWGFLLGGLIGLVLAGCIIGYLEWQIQEKRTNQRLDAALDSAKTDLDKHVQAMQAPATSRVRERVLIAIIKHRAQARLQQDGFKLIDKDGTPLTREKARALVDRLEDEVIVGAIREASPGTVTLMVEDGRLAQFLQWIADHQDEIIAILKLILTILALMG